MDFLDPSKNRAQTIRLFIGYFLVGAAIALASLILLFQSYGYDLDRRTGRVIQNGLVFVSSHPVSTALYVNGQYKAQTSARLSIPSGNYTIELKQTGYRTWKRTFTLQGGDIEQLIYPLLFPQKLVTSDVQLYGSSPPLSTESPDRHWIMIEEPGSETTFDVFDANNPQQVSTTITLPDGLLSASTEPQSLSLVEWSTDNRHVLLKHTYGTQTEYIMVDRQTPADSFNVNKLFNISPSRVTLRNKSYDKLFIYNAQSEQLQTGDIKTRQLSPYLSNVLDYRTYGSDTILYVNDDHKTQGQVALKLWDGSKNYTIDHYPSSSFVLNLTRYSGHLYVAAGSLAQGRVQIYQDPIQMLQRNPNSPPIALSVLRIDNPQFISFSDNARFIATQRGSHLAVYDIDTDRRYYYDLPFPLQLTQKATWMDGHRLVVVNDGKVVVFDFDGTNQQTLSPALTDTLPLFDRDYTGLYALSPSTVVPGKAALTRTKLVVGGS